MRVTISIRKDEVDSKVSIFEEIVEMAGDIREGDDVYLLSPKPGKLFQLLDVLKEHDVNYETRFNLTDDFSNTRD